MEKKENRKKEYTAPNVSNLGALKQETRGKGPKVKDSYQEADSTSGSKCRWTPKNQGSCV